MNKIIIVITNNADKTILEDNRYKINNKCCGQQEVEDLKINNRINKTITT